MRGSMRPTKRSRNRIGSTYQPNFRFSGGKNRSHTYEKPNREASSGRSQTSGSNGDKNATDGGSSGGAPSSSTSSRRTKRFAFTPSTSTATSPPSAISSLRIAVRPGVPRAGSGAAG